MKTVNEYIIMAIAVILFFGVTAAKMTFVENNFNGKWVLDTAKSDFGGIPMDRAAPNIMTLTQTVEAITFERNFQSIPVPSKQTLTLDGKILESKKDQNLTIRTLKMSNDKSVLTVISKVHMTQEGTVPWDYIRTETYALLNDGKCLLLTRLAVTPDGTETVRAFYDREK